MKFFSFFLLFIPLHFLSANNTNLSQISITNLNINSGLASNDVTCILQDELGFMWFGTTNGLCRYDGYQLKTYRSDYLSPSFFISNHILSMKRDNNGKFWIVTSKGITVFDPMIGQVLPISIDTSKCGKISSLLITQQGDILLGTSNGLFLCNKLDYQVKFLIKADISSLYEDSRGYIWVGTWRNGFFTLNMQTMEVFNYDTICRNKDLRITSFAEDNNHRMWVSMWNNQGIMRLENPFDSHSSAYKFYYSSSKDGALPSDVIHELVYDSYYDELWVATARGLAVLSEPDSTNSFTVYDADELGGYEVWTIYSDRKNILWASASGGGINKLVKRKVPFVHNTISVGTADNTMVTALYEDESSIIWIGARLDILLLWDKKTGKQYSYKEIDILRNISGNAVQSITKHQKTGDIWLGTRYDGIYIVKRNGTKPVSLIRLRDEYPDLININAIVQDTIGKMWIATEQGLFVGESINEQEYLIKPVAVLNNIISNKSIQTVLCDKGGIWIGTKDYGAFYLSLDEKLTDYNLANGKLNYDNVLCFYQDSNEQLWIGTQGGGLSKYSKVNDHFEMLENIQMFSNNIIYSIVEDKDRNLWMATGKGVICMSLVQENHAKLYTQSEGLVNAQFIKSTSLRLSNSEILFGGTNGIDCYIPSQNVLDSVIPKTAIVDVSIMNVSLQELIDKGQVGEKLLPPYTKELLLAYNQNNVQMSFSCLSYTNPQANRYAYRMMGVNKNWIYVDANNRHISYNNLDTGEYVFQVRSCNENSVWSQPVEMKLTIMPPPWLTWQAYVIYILVIGIITYMVFRIIRKRIRLQNALKIEQIEHKKSEEVNQAKLTFFTNISHELFTPLSVLQCSIDSLKQDGKADGQTLNIMRLNLKRLQRLLQQILEFRKVESGNLKLKVSYNNIVAFVKELCEENFHPLLQSKNITLNFQAEQDVIMAYFDVDKLDKIIYNLLSNALKYNYQNGMVLVSLSQMIQDNKKYFVLKVENTGDGIPENKIPLLFKRFYEGDYRKFKTKGTGIGLSLTKDLVELHHGTISVQSILNETTVFTVMIPSDKQSYAIEQIDEESEEIKNENLKKELKPITEEAVIIEETNNERAHLLLVEDDMDLLAVMTKVLSKQFNVSTAVNGKIAIDILQEDQNIDAVITDYMMPEMNGVELCRIIRNDSALNHLPIVMLTAKTQTEYHLEGYDAGADVYITKPVEMVLLTAQIQVLITNRKLLIQQFRQQDNLDICDLDLSVFDRDFLDKAIAAIEQQMDNSEFSNEIFSEMMNMSQSTLYRKLKSLTGMSLNEFIRDIRIKKACMLLRHSDLRIAEIAYMVGFTDPKYFREIFKKKKGMTPKEYQESLKQSN